MTMQKRNSHRPYVMRGPPRPTKRRAAVLDKPDGRLAPTAVRTLSPDQLRSLPAPASRIDPRLRAVHRCFERWAVTHGDTEHLPLMARSEPLYRSSGDRPPPLDEGESLIVDAVYKSAPNWARHFVKLWYRAQATADDIQEVLSINTRRAVYLERQHVLFFFLGRLIQAGLQLDPRGHGDGGG